MRIKRNLIILLIISLTSVLTIINIKNPIKTKFYLFTSQIEKISLGNLITISFLFGYSFSSILSLMSRDNSNNTFDKNDIYDSESENSIENDLDDIPKSDRPPERDIRESQPTISVNYRFVEQDNNSYKYKINKNNEDNLDEVDSDWINTENNW